jgi:eukaryotic-like serine/threonine-protein kinase
MLATGTRIGGYEIVDSLGAGGMGEVYRARDIRLHRDVAVKLLPDAFATDLDRIARFEREAKALAALNHPHIAQLYGLEESGARHFLVMELVPGESLDRRIARGRLPPAEALTLARQIAEALEAAHEKGIVHRDLKPANIKLTADGQVKVLDFGLAKALDERAASGQQPALTHSPTLSIMATQAGIILGTASYMSPEQAKGLPADQRSDIFSLGVILFEMLAGRQPFAGETAPEILASVLIRDADFETLPADLSPRLVDLLKRCLQKHPRQRWQHVGDVRAELEAIAADPHGTRDVPTRASRRLWPRLWPPALAAVIAGALAGALAWQLKPAAPVRVMRFGIVPALPNQLSIQGQDRDIAISPDGARIAYRGGNSGLFVRGLDQLDAQPLSTGPSRSPFFSPDGRWIGFFEGAELKKISITGGTSMPVCRILGGARGASWGSDDTVVFATNDTETGLMTVPAGGGDAKPLTTPDPTRGEADHLFPSVLPGGRGVLFTVTRRDGLLEAAHVDVLDLRTGERKTVIRGGADAQYVESGHIVYGVGGTLRAVRFDLARLQVTSDPLPVADHVLMSGTGAAEYSTSRDGTLVYVPGGAAGAETTTRSLAWVTRDGREEPINAPPRAYVAQRLSPDGSRIALQVADRGFDIWTWDLARETLTPLTFGPAVEGLPVWTPDSRWIIFNSSRAGANNVFRHAADGSGVDERLTTSPFPQNPFSISPDGKTVLLGEVRGTTSADVVQLDLAAAAASGGKGQTSPLLQTPAAEFGPDISPDGRWIAYQSNESSQFEIYVRPFPRVDDGRWQVSTAGGTKPLWSRTGRELFYVDAHNVLMSVPVRIDGPTLSFGNPSKVLDAKYYGGTFMRSYDVSADGKRFLMIKDGGAGDTPSSPPSGFVVVLNWFEELKQRLPTK